MTKPISRRDFGKAVIAGVGGLIGAAIGIDKAFGGEHALGKEFDPHSLLPIYPWNTMTGLLIDGQGKLQRTEPPPKNIEDALQDQLHIFVPWIGPDPRKPDAPGGVCTFTAQNGDHVTVDLVRKPEIKFEMINENPPVQEDLDIKRLTPVFDSNTGNTIITNEDGLVVRVVPPPLYQQGLADRNFSATIPYHMLKPGYFDIPYPPGWCVTTTDAGTTSEKKTSTALQYARSIQLV